MYWYGFSLGSLWILIYFGPLITISVYSGGDIMREEGTRMKGNRK